MRKRDITQKQWFKIGISVSCFLFAIYIFSLLNVHRSYNISIYDQIPNFIYFFLFITFVLSFSISFLKLWSGETAIPSLLPALTIVILLFFSPSLLGYGIEYGDAMTHVGNVNDIVTSHGFPQGAFPTQIYPLVHIFVSLISIITKAPTAILFEYSLLFFGFCCSLFLVLLGRQYSVKPSAVLLFLPLVIHMSLRALTPSGFAYLSSFVILLYICIRISEQSDQRLILVGLLVLAALWTQHLFVAFVLFAGISLAQMLSIFTHGNKTPKINVIFSMLFIIAGFIWARYLAPKLYKMGALTIMQMLGVYSHKSQFNPAGGVGSNLQELGFSVIDVVWLGIRRFGGWGALFILSTAGIFWFMIFDWRWDNEIRLLPLILIIFCFFWSLGELAIGIVPSINFIRILRPAAILSPIFAGLVICRIINMDIKPLIKRLAIIMICVLLVLGTIFAAGSVYRAPWNLGGNTFTTDSEVTAWNWHFEYKETSKTTVTLERRVSRYGEYVLSPSEEKSRLEEIYVEMRAPSHFLYENGTKLSSRQGYYIEDKRSRIMNLEVGDTSDFSRREIQNYRYSTPGVDVIYSNGNVNISTM